jgi:hypothetical protein
MALVTRIFTSSICTAGKPSQVAAHSLAARATKSILAIPIFPNFLLSVWNDTCQFLHV